ncbi:MULTISPECIES: DMT family transporter [Prauserella salsuginis group]|uniref:DMT family transporter n=1 Tax=Prauserella salsuginis TaxID=387889 RepID=A0ABW6GAK2_9PSEU|nr:MULTISPECIES: SMR family transporter [Prauserella salsuginis group]
MISLGMLTHALRTVPVGTAYGAWIGIGAVGVALTGMVRLGEPASRTRLLSIAAIVAGVVGLSLTG